MIRFMRLNDSCIIIKGTISIDGAKNIDKYNRNLTLKSNASFMNCISKINKAVYGVITENSQVIQQHTLNFLNTRQLLGEVHEVMIMKKGQYHNTTKALEQFLKNFKYLIN